MKKFLLLTVMCVLGLFGTLRAQETSFSYDFEDGTLTGWRAYQGEGTSTANAWQVAEGKGVDGSMGIYSYSCKLVPPYNIPMEKSPGCMESICAMFTLNVIFAFEGNAFNV